MPGAFSQYKYEIQNTKYKTQNTKYKTQGAVQGLCHPLPGAFFTAKSHYNLSPSVLSIQFTIRGTLIDYSVDSVNQTISNQTADEIEVLYVHFEFNLSMYISSH